MQDLVIDVCSPLVNLTVLGFQVTFNKWFAKPCLCDDIEIRPCQRSVNT